MQHSRNQIEKIVKPILYECREKGHQVTATLAAYIAQTIYNKDTKKFYLEDDIMNNPELKNKVIQLSLEKLKKTDLPNMQTIRMQIAYEYAFIAQETLRQEQITKQSISPNSSILGPAPGNPWPYI